MALSVGLALCVLLLAWLMARRLRSGRAKPEPHAIRELETRPLTQRPPLTQEQHEDEDKDKEVEEDEDEDVTRLHGATPRGFDDSVDLRLLDDLNTEPAELRSDSRVIVSYQEDAEEEETTSPLARILVSARGDSDTGKKRSTNQDSLLFLPERSLFAVADGMGGYAGGEVASSLAVETVRQSFERESFVGELRSPKPIPRRGHELASAILQSNWAVFQAARENPTLSQMGTTLVATRFSPNKQRVYIGHVGDSRCYRFRGGALHQLTTDHTMRQIGLLGPGSNDLFQAIGVTEDLSIDLIVDRPAPNDVYLLCSDGLPKMVSDAEIARILGEESDLEAAVYGLIERANDHGGVDNVSVILVKVIERVIRPGLTPPQQTFNRWLKPPRAALPEVEASEDVTVVGHVAFDEPTTIGAQCGIRPPK